MTQIHVTFDHLAEDKLRWPTMKTCTGALIIPIYLSEEETVMNWKQAFDSVKHGFGFV